MLQCSVAFRFTLNTLIYMYYLHCWENGVLHSTHVRFTGQLQQNHKVRLSLSLFPKEFHFQIKTS